MASPGVGAGAHRSRVPSATSIRCWGDEPRQWDHTYPVAIAMLPTMLADDRRRAGWSVEQAAGLGVTPAFTGRSRPNEPPTTLWNDRRGCTG